MKKVSGFCLLAVLGLLLTTAATAQSVDAFFGFNTLVTGTNASGLPKMGGGFFPSAGGDLIFLPHNFGIGMQVTWRGNMQNYGGLGARPILYTFNLAWEPAATYDKVRPDFEIGFGSQNLRFYQAAYTCTLLGGCTNYQSSKHLVLHAGLGVKVYVSEHVFLRPAVDYYNIRHNYEYGVPAAWQVGVSIGYTLGPQS